MYVVQIERNPLQFHPIEARESKVEGRDENCM